MSFTENMLEFGYSRVVDYRHVLLQINGIARKCSSGSIPAVGKCRKNEWKKWDKK